jgi:hypothetical protein
VGESYDLNFFNLANLLEVVFVRKYIRDFYTPLLENFACLRYFSTANFAEPIFELINSAKTLDLI